MVAVVVPKQGQDLRADEVMAFCQRRLATFKVPKAVLFMPSLPKNPSGKLLKRELRLKFQEHFKA